MPTQKDLKRLVRSRMKKTGESYTAARGQLVRKKTASKVSSVPSPDLAIIAGMKDDALRAKTGRSWTQWIRVLDAIDAATLPHRDIAAHVHDVHKVDGWWAQTVTVGYERIKGLRDRGQRRDGQYEFSKSRTFALPVEIVYRAFASAPVRKKWLGDVGLTVRKATPPKSVRMTWPDQTRVEVSLIAKGTKSVAAITHSKLPSKEAATMQKAWWNERLVKLSELLAK